MKGLGIILGGFADLPQAVPEFYILGQELGGLQQGMLGLGQDLRFALGLDAAEDAQVGPRLRVSGGQFCSPQGGTGGSLGIVCLQEALR